MVKNGHFPGIQLGTHKKVEKLLLKFDFDSDHVKMHTQSGLPHWSNNYLFILRRPIQTHVYCWYYRARNVLHSWWPGLNHVISKLILYQSYKIVYTANVLNAEYFRLPKCWNSLKSSLIRDNLLRTSSKFRSGLKYKLDRLTKNDRYIMDLTGLMAEPLIVTSIPNFVRDFNFIERTFIDPIHLRRWRLILEVNFAYII